MAGNRIRGIVTVQTPHVGGKAFVKRLDDPQVYCVPDEIPDGATVKVLAFQPGYFDVEYKGRTFKLFSGCLIASDDLTTLRRAFPQKF